MKSLTMGFTGKTGCLSSWTKRSLSFVTRAVLGVSLLVSGMASAAPVPDSFADLSERLLPSVVNIATTHTVKGRDQGMPDLPQFPQGSPFDELFRDFFGRQGQSPQPRNQTALGSGFIVNAEKGLIVTNAHVVADADEISVILHDEKVIKAEIAGRDARLDIALLKLIDPPSGLVSVPFGNSDKMRVGDWVIAIGNPYGLGGSVSAGIISARARDIQAGPYDDFFQTDAAINKGNSGGPLFNLAGEVIGINTAIFSPSGGSVGIGFSIPSNLVTHVVADLEKYGRTHRGWLGVRIQTVTDEIAESLNMPKGKGGALVAGLEGNSPAGKAGIQPGDVITRFDGKDVTEMRRLPRIVAETQVGRDVDVEIWRKGQLIYKKVKLGEMPETEDVASSGSSTPKAAGGQLSIEGLGLTLAPLSESLSEKYDIPSGTEGVLVAKVEQGGQAAERGLRAGDLILEVSREKVKSPKDFSDKIAKARAEKRKSVLLLVMTEGVQRWTPLTIAKPEQK